MTDAQWARIRPLLPALPGRRCFRGERLFFDAVLYRTATGIPWRDLPERFGPWKSVYNRFCNWAKRGRWNALFIALQLPDQVLASVLDASVVRAHQCAAGAKGGSEITV